MSFLSKLFKDANTKVIEKIQPIVDEINRFSVEFEKLTDGELTLKTSYLKERLKSGKTLDEILPEAFALVREANRRTIKVRHFDVQLVGGVALHRGEIAEMKTGEGKTHVAALALYLNALSGQGAHLITVNDYLAKRDAGWNGAANYLLGMRTSCLIHDQALIFDPAYDDETQKDERLKHLKPCSRKEAYAADITYGTNSEFGFDYLRDNMVGSLEQMVQRDSHFAIVDEVDSVLIDEARTPLIISAPAEESAGLYKKFAQMVPRLRENEDYNVDEKMRAATLTDAGVQKFEQWLGMGNIYTEGGIQFVHHVEQALNAHALYKRDKDYVVKDGEIIIIDEFTGRLMHGRRYSEGLHQAIEAKEGVEVQKESRTLATITIQNYFRMYKKLAGMTGTAATEAEEFSKIYGLDVTVVSTNKPVVRRDLPDRIYSTEAGKFKAVVREIKQLYEKEQPVLVGTISIERNEMLSLLLTQEGVPHKLLNAKHHEKEAEIIAQAGRAQAVTVATNMAGRGVDIVLGGTPFDKEEYEKVKALGGLFVLGTERHEARRIDNQLRGRGGRQGDPGASQFYISMEDDLMRVFGSDRVKNMMRNMGMPEDMPIENRFISNAIEKAQQRVEGNNFDIRKHLVEYDDVINKQRTIIYKNRKEILRAADERLDASKQKILEMVEKEIKSVVLFHTAGEDQSQWNMREICEVAGTIFPVTAEFREQVEALGQIAGDKSADAAARTNIIDALMMEAQRQYDLLEKAVVEHTGSAENMRLIEKEILIRGIDNLWVDHLDAIYALRAGIGLRGYGQRDPLIEFKRETFQMFVQLQNLIQKQVVYTIYKIGLTTKLAKSVMETENINISKADGSAQFQQASALSAGAGRKENAGIVKKAQNDAGEKVGRNDPCPCGSGLKYKKCHGS
ncbi:preprotein translocase subunit SecA [Candidatus Falkowbacteria bacterium]|nr:preprotein translocase subunit SecA [Candidatus Falkowbacteria bacterium]